MNNYPDFDASASTTLYESNSVIKGICMAWFVAAVFIVPPAALIRFFIA